MVGKLFRLFAVHAIVLTAVANGWAQEAPQSFESQNKLLSQKQFLQARAAFERVRDPRKWAWHPFQRNFLRRLPPRRRCEGSARRKRSDNRNSRRIPRPEQGIHSGAWRDPDNDEGSGQRNSGDKGSVEQPEYSRPVYYPISVWSGIRGMPRGRRAATDRAGPGGRQQRANSGTHPGSPHFGGSGENGGREVRVGRAAREPALLFRGRL
jgi:hypothetical protein